MTDPSAGPAVLTDPSAGPAVLTERGASGSGAAVWYRSGLAERIDALAGDPAVLPRDVIAPVDVLADDDLQLALWVMYELHYRGFDGVADGWEWDPDLLRLRRDLAAEHPGRRDLGRNAAVEVVLEPLEIE